MASDGIIDFYVSPLAQSAGAKVSWLVCKGALSNCVGIEGDLAAATAQAVRMAAYQTSCGKIAQAHVPDGVTGEWRTVGCTPGTERRFR